MSTQDALLADVEDSESEADGGVAQTFGEVGNASSTEKEEPKAETVEEETKAAVVAVAAAASEAAVLPVSPDMALQILSRVPLKQRTRLKKVSKGWRDFISMLRRTMPLRTSTYLVLSLGDSQGYTTTFLAAKDEGREVITKSFNPQPWVLQDVRHGLLLYWRCSSGEVERKDSNKLFLCCPEMKFLQDDSHPNMQQLILPSFDRCASRYIASLLFDGQHHFKVMCHFWDGTDTSTGKTIFKIFSSGTWEWKELTCTIIDSFLLHEDNFRIAAYSRECLYRKGKLYRVWSGCLLVYDEKVEEFTLMKLPRRENASTRDSSHRGRMLFESEGRINLCNLEIDRFHIYNYNGVGSDEMWQLNQQISYANLIGRDIATAPGVTNTGPLTARQLRFMDAFAFNEDLQVVFFSLPSGIILAYSFETQEWVKVWKVPDKYFISTVKSSF